MKTWILNYKFRDKYLSSIFIRVYLRSSAVKKTVARFSGFVHHAFYPKFNSLPGAARPGRKKTIDIFSFLIRNFRCNKLTDYSANDSLFTILPPVG